MSRRNDRTSGSSARGMIPTSTYHSAHRPPHDAPELDRWEGPSCLAFVHDLMSSPSLPPEFDVCDVLSAEIPWQRGFGTFNERAQVSDDRTYGQFLGRVSEIVAAESRPVYLLTGRHALGRLPEPDSIADTMLNEWEAVILGYRPDPQIAAGTFGVTQELYHALAQRYETAGDFCCGYGRTGRFFLRSGKRAVLSDFNPQCVGYIAEHAPTWGPT